MKLEEIGFYSLSNNRMLNSGPDSQMQRCEMIINDYCNFSCPYCKGLDQSIFADRKRREMTLEEMKRNVDYWCDSGPLQNIRFSGGEPTLHKNIVEIVAYAKEKGITRIAISTNGSNSKELYDQLIEAGVNDFSFSLDAKDATTGDYMAGGIPGAWNKVIDNIRYVSKKCYTTVGMVLTPKNIDDFVDTVEFASSLGVTDIRVISSAQWNRPLTSLADIPEAILRKHPILRYRIGNFIEGKPIRGINDNDANKCGLLVDDSVIAGQFHYPCVIYMREQGAPIGKVGPTMREDRVKWYNKRDTHKDPICKKNCLDVCVDYNNKFEEQNKWKKNS